MKLNIRRLTLAIVLIAVIVLAILPECWGAGSVLQRKGFVAGTSGITNAGPYVSTMTNPAGGSANPWDYTATLGIMDGNDNFTLWDINLTNVNHTGSGNAVQVMDVAAITGDAQATETVFTIGSGWDAGISCESPIVVTDTATLAKSSIVNEATATRLVTATDYGSIIACSYAGATTVTLPDPSEDTVGATFYITQLVDQSLTIVGGSTANNNSIIADGVLTADNVAFSTASHKIGAMCRVVGISATKWLITNASACTMTVEAAD